VGFDVLTTCQPSTVWCSRERLPAVAAQPAKVRQSCCATDKKKTVSRNRRQETTASGEFSEEDKLGRRDTYVEVKMYSEM
jgi:hypothetical protein